jgi:ribosome-binding factor A
VIVILRRKLHLEPFDMRREDDSAGHRHARLQGLILEELRALLRDDVSDPALAGVRIVAVVLSVDYRNARVHFALRMPGVAHPDEASGRRSADQALLRATPFLRARLADAIDVKRVPDLRFLFDGTVPDGEDDDVDANTDTDPDGDAKDEGGCSA